MGHRSVGCMVGVDRGKKGVVGLSEGWLVLMQMREDVYIIATSLV